MSEPRRRKMVAIDVDVLRATSHICRDEDVSLTSRPGAAEDLKKKGQPVTLREALKQSAKIIAAKDRRPAAIRGVRKPRAGQRSP